MSVSDLTGTTWMFTTVPSISAVYNLGSTEYNITGTYKIVKNDVEQSVWTPTNTENKICRYYSSSTGNYILNIFTASPTSSGCCIFTNRQYGIWNWKTSNGGTFAPYTTDTVVVYVSITGGTDVTDSTLISWLGTNATQVVDLTGTTWVWNDSNIASSGSSGFDINFNSNNLSFTSIGDSIDSDEAIYYGNLAVYDAGVWQANGYKTIEITGGTDVTNATLVAWLEANATQVIDPPSGGNIEFGTFSISNTHWGTRDIDKMIYNDIVIYEKSQPPTTGYNLTINFIARNYVGEGMTYLRFKLNEEPTDEHTDYDAQFYTPWAGDAGAFDVNEVEVVNVGYNTGGTYTINNVSSFTYWLSYWDTTWGDFVGVNSNTNRAPEWDNRVTINLTQDTTLNIYYDYDT